MVITFDPMAKTWDRASWDSLLAAIKETGHKKYHIAERLGVPASTVSDWVSGKHAPHPIFQRQFATIEKEFRRKPLRKTKPPASDESKTGDS